MKTLKATFKIITPLVLGGAEPDHWAELRAPSIKGAMRFWYRAIDPEYEKWEEFIFGGTDEGQSKFSIRLDKNLGSNDQWKPWEYALMDEDHPGKSNAPCYSSKDTWVQNGIRYLSYSLRMGDNDRRYIKPGESFTLTVNIRPIKGKHKDEKQQDEEKKKEEEKKVVRAVVSSLWLLGHVGGLGARARRGLGTVALTSWDISSIDEEDQLPIAHGKTTPKEWFDVFKNGLTNIKAWYSGNCTDDHSVFSTKTCFYLFEKGHDQNTRNGKDKKTGETITKNYEPWEEALNAAGLCMQGFRQRSDIADRNSDYYRVKAHLEKAYEGKAPPSSGLKPAYVQTAPARVAFGLPLTFQYTSLKYQDGYKWDGKENYITPRVEFKGNKKEHERSASPIHIRIVEINGKCHPFYILLDAPLLPKGEKIKASDRSSPPADQPDGAILDTFWSYMKTNFAGEEVTW